MEELIVSLRSLALTYVDITDVIGDRIHLDTIPENASYPCIRAKVVTDTRRINQSNIGPGFSTIQWDVFHTDRVSVGELVETIRDIFHGYTGPIGDYARSRILVRNVPSDWIEDVRLFNKSLELDIGYG